ncbi:DUF885 family protein [Niveispirillum sp.]|uniref:DUF885 domain-containing protein n=1 Tax=Niveispirillum sp. TaxID=1917217 RepID=UPI001B712690|nr:DUF885 domain-containing protein [Niveispirillum sp.]MBP7336727.1 DUF885 domain-containing protein [Niveispirillum sp.]
MRASTALADLATRFWTFQCAEFPTVAIAAGVSTEAEQLLREAPADAERRAVWARAAQGKLAAIDPAPLGVQDRATHRLLNHEFRLLTELVDSGAHLRPTLYPLGPEFTLIYWANSTALATTADAQRYLRRLAAIPTSFATVQESLAQGVAAGMVYSRLVVERAIAQIRGQMSMKVEDNAFFGPLARIAARGGAMAALAADGKALVKEVVIPAFLSYAAYLEKSVLPPARDSLACTDDVDGDRFYRYHIGQYTTLDIPPADIHAIGLTEVERIQGEMLAVAGAAGFSDDLDGFRQHLQTDSTQFATSAEVLREQIEVLSKRIDARIPEFFGRLPRISYGVSSIPVVVADKMPPAYAQPNPADGSAAGIHWITSLPGKCPRYMHLPLALHEAWPGHLMHLALIQEMDQLPDFRRFGALKYAACLEGWALYCEALGEDMGFYDTPEKRYGRLEMEMWRALRLVLDTGIHSRGWGRDQAIAYFRENMAMPLETLTAEVDRYIGMPGQALAYQLGNLKFRELRARAEAALGQDFRIRDFHDALMAAGAVTLPVLELLIDDWISGTTLSAVS